MVNPLSSGLPAVFNRVTFNGYMVGRDKYLLTHRVAFEFRQFKEGQSYPLHHEPRVLEEWMEPWLPIVPTHDHRHLPLCHPEDWMSVACYFHRRFRLLTIDATQVEKLTNEEHPALIRGEYFGRVPLRAILRDEEYSWEPSESGLQIPRRAIDFFTENGSLKHTIGYRPVRLPQQAPSSFS